MLRKIHRKREETKVVTKRKEVSNTMTISSTRNSSKLEGFIQMIKAQDNSHFALLKQIIQFNDIKNRKGRYRNNNLIISSQMIRILQLQFQPHPLQRSSQEILHGV